MTAVAIRGPPRGDFHRDRGQASIVKKVPDRRIRSMVAEECTALQPTPFPDGRR
jgi:hypothetical protein